MTDNRAWVEMPLPRLPGIVGEVHAFQKGACRVLVGQEPRGGRLRWHLSISCQHRYPHWEEIKDARYSLLPHPLTFGQILPPPGTVDQYSP